MYSSVILVFMMQIVRGQRLRGMQARTQNSKPSTSARPVLGATIFTVFDSFQSLSIVYFQVRMSCWPKKHFNMQLSTVYIFSELIIYQIQEPKL